MEQRFFLKLNSNDQVSINVNILYETSHFIWSAQSMAESVKYVCKY